MKVVSLLASAYSGSTILSMAVGSRPEIYGFGDTYFHHGHPLHRCSCGELFRECSFRRKMNAALAERGFPDYWDNATPVAKGALRMLRVYFRLKQILPGGHRALHRVLTRTLVPNAYRALFKREHDAFFEVLEAETGSEHYFDGCKSVYRAQLMCEIYPGTKILHLVRDPRGFIASSVKHFKEQNGSFPDASFVDARLGDWAKYNSRAAAYEHELAPGQYLRVQYGDLLSHPQDELKRILDFFGLRGEYSEPTTFDRERLHVSGNTTNLTSRRIEQRTLGDWKKYTDVIDFARIERETRDLPFVQLEGVPAKRTEIGADQVTRQVS